MKWFAPIWIKLTKRLRWLTHPITIFVGLQIIWLAITIIWVIWFVGQQAQISQLAQKFGRQYFDSGVALAILIVGCVLLGMLLVGTISLFVFGQRQTYLASQQRSFVSSVTHELKSPLASLQLAFETIERHKLDEATAKQMHQIVLSDIERLRRLVDQILVAGRLDRGMAMHEKNERTSLEAVVAKIVKTSAYLDPALMQRVQLKDPWSVIIKDIANGLGLILTNLIENAVKYSEPGSLIAIATEIRDEYLIMSVTDQGLGLDKKESKRIFRMFHRSPRALNQAIPGTGLGLYIVRSVVKGLDGNAWAQSEGIGKGSTFFVKIPLTHFELKPVLKH